MKHPARLIALTAIFSLLFLVSQAMAAKLLDVRVIDKDYLFLHFADGEIKYNEPTTGPAAYTNIIHDISGNEAYNGFYDKPQNEIIDYGALSINAATNTGNWTIKSADDPNYGAAGKKPSAIHRKTKMSGQAEFEWAGSDFRYEYVHDHYLYLRLPNSLSQGKTYTIEIGGSVNSNENSASLTYDIYSTRSEAIRVNVHGYATTNTIKAADLFVWMGDGDARDFSWAEGNKVYIYNVDTQQPTEVGTVSFGKANGGDVFGRNVTNSAVWHADFTGFTDPGNYRLAIEGIGSSDEFKISPDIYYEPFKVSTQGYFYMRVGQDSVDIHGNTLHPIPRRPLWLPGISPEHTVVHITSTTYAGSGDGWDDPNAWAAHKTGRTNPNAWGGHSDALDWDRHAGHTANIYDMLLPFILTEGKIDDDNLGIAESGDGIPDLLQETAFEVDYWLRLRDGAEFSRGLTNPNKSGELFQAAPSKIMAWASAAAAAMLSDCYRLSGHTDLMEIYRDSAISAINVAGGQGLDDQIPHTSDHGLIGRDLAAIAGAHLYNVTGDTKYEDMMANYTKVDGPNTTLYEGKRRTAYFEIAAYSITPHTVNYPDLLNNMKSSVINQAKSTEVNNIAGRPSRRSTHNLFGYWLLAHNVQQTMIAHKVSSGADKQLFEDALILEADYGLGRNSDNRIMMTTASSDLAHEKSFGDIYTSGQADGVEGLHPGHTPYLNRECWSGGMTMGCPPQLFQNSYPGNINSWPASDMWLPSRYAWAHNEFTPRQTMRGKQALYGYLYGIGAKKVVSTAHNSQIPGPVGLNPAKSVTLNALNIQLPVYGDYTVSVFNLSGRQLVKSTQKITESFTPKSLTPKTPGIFIMKIAGHGVEKSVKLVQR